MSRNSESMTPIQKQAVLVCAVCALAVLITASVTYVLLATKGEAPSSSVVQVEEPDDLATHYQVDTQSSALLAATADAGEAYLSDTLFLGDSNTVRLYNNGLISLQQFCAKEGIGLQSALSEQIVTFRGTEQRYTIAEAVAMMKPRRVVITLGTNDNGMAVEDFIGYYTQLVQAIQTGYPYTDIIVNTVPPVPQDHSHYPEISQEKIDDFNMALLTMCENLGVKFLNSAEVLKDPATGYGLDDYYIAGDIHLKSSGLKAMLSYLTTHAYETEDRRPDTNNIPTRTLEYTSNPSDPVAPSSSEAQGETYEARYRIDQAGGTLTSGDSTGNESLRFDVTEGRSVTVTAVPDKGYLFVNWSDGVTTPTRTDSGFKQNLDVTAVFSPASVEISGAGSGMLGMNYTFTAKLSGQYAKAENLHWYVNGEESVEAAGRTSITFIVDPLLANQTYTVYAAVVYNDSRVVSNSLTVSFREGVSDPGDSSSSSGDAGSSSGSSSSSSGSGSSSGSSSASGSSSSGSSSGADSEQASASSRPGDDSSSSSAGSGSSSGSSRPSGSSSGSSSASSSSGSSRPQSGSSSSGSASGSSSSGSSRPGSYDDDPEGPAASGSSGHAGSSSSSSRPSGSSSGSSASRGEDDAPSSSGSTLDDVIDGLFGVQ